MEAVAAFSLVAAVLQVAKLCLSILQNVSHTIHEYQGAQKNLLEVGQYCLALETSIGDIANWVNTNLAQTAADLKRITVWEETIGGCTRQIKELQRDVDKIVGKNKNKYLGVCRKLRLVGNEITMDQHLTKLERMTGALHLLWSTRPQNNGMIPQVAPNPSGENVKTRLNQKIQSKFDVSSSEDNDSDFCNKSILTRSSNISIAIRSRTQKSIRSQGIPKVVTKKIGKTPLHRARQGTQRKPQPGREGIEMASKFGDIAIMTYTSFHAIAYRRLHKEHMPTNFKALYDLCKAGRGPFETLRSRFLHAEFIRQWHQLLITKRNNMISAGEKPCSERNLERWAITPELGIEDYACHAWLDARKKKSRYMVWFELMQIFGEELGRNAHVIVCAATGTSSNLENMKRKQLEIFLQDIRSRKNSLLPGLRTVAHAFNYVVDEVTSLDTLRLEIELRHLKEGEEIISGLTIERLQDLFSPYAESDDGFQVMVSRESSVEQGFSSSDSREDSDEYC